MNDLPLIWLMYFVFCEIECWTEKQGHPVMKLLLEHLQTTGGPHFPGGAVILRIILFSQPGVEEGWAWDPLEDDKACDSQHTHSWWFLFGLRNDCDCSGFGYSCSLILRVN